MAGLLEAVRGEDSQQPAVDGGQQVGFAELRSSPDLIRGVHMVSADVQYLCRLLDRQQFLFATAMAAVLRFLGLRAVRLLPGNARGPR